MYKNGVPVNQNQKGNNNNINNNNQVDNDPYGFVQMSYEQAFGIKKKWDKHIILIDSLFIKY